MALFGLMAWAYAALCGVGLWRAWHADKLADKSALIKFLLLHLSVATVVGMALMVLGIKMALSAAGHLPDSDERKIKW